MSLSAHFDRRGSTYDRNEAHRRIIDLLVSGAAMRPGMKIVDVATGTGAAALKAAEIVGSTGEILGIDISERMLAEARRKTAAEGLSHVRFVIGDAEHFELPAESVDFIFCASGLVMMKDIPGAIRRWAGWLRPQGFLAFDVPSKPFGMAEMIARAAFENGISLPYDTVADTPDRCRVLLQGAGLKATRISTEVVSHEFISVDDAIKFLDERLDHPAWRALSNAPKHVRDATRAAYIESINERAVADRIESEVAQNFVYAQKDSPQSS